MLLTKPLRASLEMPMLIRRAVLWYGTIPRVDQLFIYLSTNSTCLLILSTNFRLLILSTCLLILRERAIYLVVYVDQWSTSRQVVTNSESARY